MRNILFFLFLMAGFSMCDVPNPADITPSTDLKPISDISQLVGKWKLIASSYSIGDAKQHWVLVMMVIPIPSMLMVLFLQKDSNRVAD